MKWSLIDFVPENMAQLKNLVWKSKQVDEEPRSTIWTKNKKLNEFQTTPFIPASFSQCWVIIISCVFFLYHFRLKEHLRLNKRETLRQLQHNIASCRPLFNIFDANRHLFCHHIIDPMNGLWFSGFLSLSFWSLLTPFVLNLASIYKKMEHSRGIIRSSSHQ